MGFSGAVACLRLLLSYKKIFYVKCILYYYFSKQIFYYSYSSSLKNSDFFELSRDFTDKPVDLVK